MKKLLHLGCGNQNKFNIKGFEDWEEIRMDIDPAASPDILKSITDLKDLPNGMVDAIYTSHTIEHLYEHEVLPMLVECKRLLSPDGFIVITCPDIETVCEEIIKHGLKEPLYNSPAGCVTGLDILYGLQTDVKNGNIYMSHKGGFTAKTLGSVLKESGFKKVLGGRRRDAYDLWFIAFNNTTSNDISHDYLAKHLPLGMFGDSVENNSTVETTSTIQIPTTKKPSLGLYSKVCYAVQVCDVSSNQGGQRYCGDDRSLLTEKSLTSLCISIQRACELIPYSQHEVYLFNDHSTTRVTDFVNRLIEKFQSKNITFKLINLEEKGIMNSIRKCYECLRDNGKELVFQIQDDYLFEPNAMFEMISLFNQVRLETTSQEEIIISPNNDPRHWQEFYKYIPLSKMFIMGKNQYWFQTGDMTCTFLTSVNQFNRHWDIYERFLTLDPTDSMLEPRSLNIIPNNRVLSFRPFTSLALHMQYEYDKEPYIDWEARWSAVPKI
jgi:hypothetical protein